MKGINAIGIMSGSSLDGLDIAYCQFDKNGQKWQFRLLNSETIPFPVPLREQLSVCRDLEGYELCRLDTYLGEWIAGHVLSFIRKNNLKPDLISSHGHTVFHQPDQQLTLQIGNGQVIATQTQLPVVTNFRQKDVLKGGQGAPLVPVGDIHLFHKYDACINLGGIANITIKNGTEVKAWDIAPCNQVMDAIAKKLGFPFDRDGKLAKSGTIDDYLIRAWKDLPFFNLDPPKSMSNEWVAKHFLNELPRPSKNALRTFAEFLSLKIEKDITAHAGPSVKSILVTGGGAKNSFLISLLQEKIDREIVVPDLSLIEFKEAIIFAFLGVLRYHHLPNILSSATGAISDSIAGTIYLP